VNYTFSDTDPLDETASRRRWHAVAVVACEAACKAARALEQKRFLSVDAPRLPLAACDAPVCECTYRHFADRRQDSRRSDSGPDAAGGAADGERRRGRGRRRTD